MQTADPMAVAFMTNLLRLWALQRPDLPPDFVDEVAVTELSRQPAAFVRIELEVVKRTMGRAQNPMKADRSTRQAGNQMIHLKSCPFDWGVSKKSAIRLLACAWGRERRTVPAVQSGRCCAMRSLYGRVSPV